MNDGKFLSLFSTALFSVLVATCAADAKSMLTEGRAALEDGLYGVAESRLLKCLDAGKDKLSWKEKNMVAGLVARAMYGQGDYDRLLKFLEQENRWPDEMRSGAVFRFWRGYAKYGKGDFKAALEELGPGGGNLKGSEYEGKAFRLAAWCEIRTGKIEKGLSLFREFDAAQQKSAQKSANLLDWGRALSSSGRSTEAVEIYKRLGKLDSDMPGVREGIYRLAVELFALGKPEEAEKHIRGLTDDKGADDNLKGMAWFLMAEIQESKTNLVKAVQSVSNGLNIARSPELKLAGRFEKARLLTDAGQVKKGIAGLRTFVSGNPDDPLAKKAQLKIAETLFEKELYGEAADEFQHYLETFSDREGQAAASVGKAWSLLKIGRYAEAATVYIKAFDLVESDAEKQKCLFKARDAYFANEQYNLASRTYLRLLDDFPGSQLKAKALLQLGESFTRREDWESAEKYFSKLVAEHPGNPHAEDAALRIAWGRVRRAENLDKRGEWNDARKVFDGAIQAFGSVIEKSTNSLLRAEAIHGRGQAHYRVFELDKALEDFERVIREYPGSSVFEHAHYMRGMCFYRMFRDKEAMDIWNEFTRKFPESEWAPKVLFEIAKYEFNQKQYKMAEKHFLMFADKYKDNPLTDEAFLWAGVAAAKRNEYRRAVELFAQMVQVCPQAVQLLPRARFEQSESLLSLGKYSAAIVILDEIINKFPESDLVLYSWLRKGDCQFMLGGENRNRYEEAIKSYRVVANNSDAGFELSLEAEYKIARCKEMLERSEEALEQYHSKVMIRYLAEREKPGKLSEASKTWFTRASFNAAALLEERNEWRKVVNVLQRLADAGVPASEKAAERIREIKDKHWWQDR